MKKTVFNKFIKSLLIIVLIFITGIANAQFPPTYRLYVTNEVSTPTTYEFDVFILHTNFKTDTMKIATMFFGLGFDVKMFPEGADLVTSYVGGSEFTDAQNPRVAASIFSTGTRDVNGITYRYFCIASRPPSGPTYGVSTRVSSVNGGCNHPGTRFGRFRLKIKNGKWVPNSKPNFSWSSSPGAGHITNTAVLYYNALDQATNATKPQTPQSPYPGHITWSSPAPFNACDKNLPVNH